MTTAQFASVDFAPVEGVLAHYFEGRVESIGEDIDLAPSNVSRRRNSAIKPQQYLDRFTGRQVLSALAADAARGGHLLDHVLRAIQPGAPRGDAIAAAGEMRAAMRILAQALHEGMEALADNHLSPEEAQVFARVWRAAMVASPTMLAHLDARAAQAVQR